MFISSSKDQATAVFPKTTKGLFSEHANASCLIIADKRATQFVEDLQKVEGPKVRIERKERGMYTFDIWVEKEMGDEKGNGRLQTNRYSLLATLDEYSSLN